MKGHGLFNAILQGLLNIIITKKIRDYLELLLYTYSKRFPLQHFIKVTIYISIWTISFLKWVNTLLMLTQFTG